MDSIALPEALDLFQLPRTLGETAEGETIVANVGRFGPYLKYGSKYASLKEDDPYTVTLERAREVIRLKKEADANRLILDFPDAGIQVLNGRYGPYITDKERNAKIPKDRDPKSLTLPECQTLLAAAPVRTFGKWGRGRKGQNGKNAAKAPARAKTAKTKGSAAETAAAPAAKAAPTKLAAKIAKAPANKKAPAKSAAPPKAASAPKGKAAAKAGSKAKKSSAKKKS
jgi:DNA topoisomerase-1